MGPSLLKKAAIWSLMVDGVPYAVACQVTEVDEKEVVAKMKEILKEHHSKDC